MIDQDKAISIVSNFLNDKNKKLLLVKGYDDDAKLKVVLGSLEKKFNKGIIRTSSMSNVPMLINRSFKKKLLPSQVKSTESYSLGKMLINISSYATNSRVNSVGNIDTFTVYYPVQSILDNAKQYDKFLEDIKRTRSKKVILITTNEWGIKNLDIENHMDEVFFYNVENDNPELMKNLRNNGAI